MSQFTDQSALCVAFSDLLKHYMGPLLKNNWTCTESHGHSVCCNALCSFVSVPCVCVFLCLFRLLCTHKCAKCVCVCFLGVLLHICAGWVMGIPCLHSPAQHASDCSVGWMPSRLHIKNPLLIPYGAAQTSYKITFPFNCSQLTVFWGFFTIAAHCSYWYLSFVIFSRDVLCGCA